MEGWESRRAPLSELGQLGAWGGIKGARKERACWEDGDRLCSCRGRTSASKELCVPTDQRQLVLGNGGSSCKFSHRSLHEPPFGTVFKEVGWRWPPLSQWLSVKEGAWVMVAAAQQAMTHGGCHC